VKVDTTYEGGHAVLRLDGRLDGEWAEYLSDALDDLLRTGTRSVILDMANVAYVSSAGTKMLARRRQDFSALRATLLVACPSAVVREALTSAGVGDLILEEATRSSGTQQVRISAELHRHARLTAEWHAPSILASHHYEIAPQERGAALVCRLHGDPARVTQGVFSFDQCRVVEFPETAFGLGLGAIGTSYEECQSRLGELAGAAGVVAYLPTDGASVPDYLRDGRDRGPRALLGCGMVCEGGFSHLVRFTAARDSGGVPLSELAAISLDAVGGSAVGLVVIAETVGLVGATLRRSPAMALEAPDFRVPAVREWLSFTAEPAYAGMTTLVIGVAARHPEPPLAAFLRPLTSGDGPNADEDQPERLDGHFHAVVFSYQPVPQRTVAMPAVVAGLFAGQTVRAILHLLADDRETGSAGQSEFLRGLCWAGPIASVTTPAA
jgi:anti-anti-sigma factor